MANSQVTLLLDTNIWLDNFLPDRPMAKESRGLIDLARQREYPLLYPISAPANVFFVVGQTLKRSAALSSGKPVTETESQAIQQIAWSCVDNMTLLGTAVGADESDMWYARKLRQLHNDLEDDLVLASIERSRPTYFVTNDLPLLKKAPCAAYTSADMLCYLKSVK